MIHVTVRTTSNDIVMQNDFMDADHAKTWLDSAKTQIPNWDQSWLLEITFNKTFTATQDNASMLLAKQAMVARNQALTRLAAVDFNLVTNFATAKPVLQDLVAALI